MVKGSLLLFQHVGSLPKELVAEVLDYNNKLFVICFFFLASIDVFGLVFSFGNIQLSSGFKDIKASENFNAWLSNLLELTGYAVKLSSGIGDRMMAKAFEMWKRFTRTKADFDTNSYNEKLVMLFFENFMRTENDKFLDNFEYFSFNKFKKAVTKHFEFFSDIFSGNFAVSLSIIETVVDALFIQTNVDRHFKLGKLFSELNCFDDACGLDGWDCLNALCFG